MTTTSQRNDPSTYRSLAHGLIATGAHGFVPVGVDTRAEGSPGSATSATTSSSAADQQLRPLLGSSDSNVKYKYPRLNLTATDTAALEYGLSPLQPLLRSPRNISQFWLDNLTLIFFFIQIHALLYLQGVEFYPSTWRSGWKWTLFFILDIHNLISGSNGVKNSGSAGMIHSIFMIIVVPLVVGGVWMWCRKRWFGKEGDAATENQQPSSPPPLTYITFLRFTLFLSELLYLPLTLVWFRMFVCESSSSSPDGDSHLVWIDRSLQCWSGTHIGLLVVASLIPLIFIIGLPYLLWHHTHSALVWKDEVEHEKYLQSSELSYLLGLNNTYEASNIYLLTSYTRTWSYSYFFRTAQKLLLVLFLITMNTYTTESSLAWLHVQCVLFLGIIGIPLLLNIIGYKTYRVAQTNHLKYILDSALCFTSLLNIITASDSPESTLNPEGDSIFTGSGGESFTENTFALVLAVVNVAALVVAGGLCTKWRWMEKKQQNTISSLSSDYFWPIHTTDLLLLHYGHSDLLSAFSIAKQFLTLSNNTPDEFYPIRELLGAIEKCRGVRDELERVRREEMGGGGKGKRGGGKNHNNNYNNNNNISQKRYYNPTILASTNTNNNNTDSSLASSQHRGSLLALSLASPLQDMLEELCERYDTITRNARKKGVNLIGSGGNTNSGTLDQPGSSEHVRSDALHSSLHGFHESLLTKTTSRALLHPLKAELISKLLVIKGIVTKGNEGFVYGERMMWGQPVRQQEQGRTPQPQQQQQQLTLQQQIHARLAHHSSAIQSQQRQGGGGGDEVKINIFANDAD